MAEGGLAGLTGLFGLVGLFGWWVGQRLKTVCLVNLVYLLCDAEGEAKIGYLVTGWPVDSMAARILARDSASNSCP